MNCMENYCSLLILNRNWYCVCSSSSLGGITSDESDDYHGRRLWAINKLESGHGNAFINIVIKNIELVFIKMYSGPVPALRCMSSVGRFISR